MPRVPTGSTSCYESSVARDIRPGSSWRWRVHCRVCPGRLGGGACAGNGACRPSRSGRWTGVSPAQSRRPGRARVAGWSKRLSCGRLGVPLAGVLIRLGTGPTLLGGPDTGLDDRTYTQFVRDTFGPETTASIPGLHPGDPTRFAARLRFLSGPGPNALADLAISSYRVALRGPCRSGPRCRPGRKLGRRHAGAGQRAGRARVRRVDLAGLAPSHAWVPSDSTWRPGPPVTGPRSSFAGSASPTITSRTTWRRTPRARRPGPRSARSRTAHRG